MRREEKKESYEPLEMEVIELEEEDVITESAESREDGSTRYYPLGE